MVKEDVFTSLKNSILRDEDKKGMSQYLLLIFADDVLFCPDLEIVRLLNSTYHGIDIMEYSEAVNRTVELLKENLNKDLIDVVYQDGEIKVKPLVVNEFSTTSEFFIFSKTKPGFILEEIYNKYFKNVSDPKLVYELFMNVNASGLLRSDCNFIIYDDTCDFTKRVLSMFTRLFHLEKLIPRSYLVEFIINNVIERQTVCDFITSDIDDILGKVSSDLIEAIKERIDNNEITVDEAIHNFSTNTLIGNLTWYNMMRLNDLDPKDRPGYNIGLAKLYSPDLNKNN